MSNIDFYFFTATYHHFIYVAVNFFISVNFYISFVSNSLAFITIPKNNGKKINSDKKLITKYTLRA